jgi:hypothetical protein
VRKFFCLLLILLMFMSVPVYAEDYELYTSDEEDFISFPVYADDDDDGYNLQEDLNFIDFLAYTEGQQVYTLEPGKVYRIEFNYLENEYADLDFSDNVVYGFSTVYGATAFDLYKYYGNSYNGSVSDGKRMFVYNWSESEINMTLNDGEIKKIVTYSPLFTLVMFDGSEEVLEMINTYVTTVNYRVHYYNEDDGSIDYVSDMNHLYKGQSRIFEGKGLLMFGHPVDTMLNRVDFNGVYEVGYYISEDFFQVPPWILRMDLAGMIRVLLDQLSMLLPVALVILSVFLLVSFLIYMVRSFL